MLEAFETLHPINGQSLKETVNGLDSDDKKADAFLAMFIHTGTSKGFFAQELAALLETSGLQVKAVPHYILEALRFLIVIKPE